jgi:hypothetical protein
VSLLKTASEIRQTNFPLANSGQAYPRFAMLKAVFQFNPKISGRSLKQFRHVVPFSPQSHDWQ